jgi:hypothetical protein
MRNIKILGLMLAAMFAMSAVAATTASADEFTAETYPVTLTGSNEPESSDVFTTTAGPVTCKKAKYVGTTTGPSTSITIAPSYEECTGFGFPAVVTVNGCHYVFNIVGGTSTNGDVDLVCPAGNQMTVVAAVAGTTKCIVHVSSQSDITGTLNYTQIGSGTTREVTVDDGISGIDYTHTEGTGIGKCTPGGSATNGTLTAKGVVTGEVDPSGSHIGVFLSNI